MDEKSLAVLSETVRNTLKKANLLIRANNIVDVDMMTACPEKGVEEAGEVSAALGGDIFALFHSDGFTAAVAELYKRRGDLEGRELILAEKLFAEQMKEKNISTEQNKENIDAKNHAWVCWLSAKENKDFRQFESALAKLIASEKKRVMSWEPLSEQQRNMPAYDRMLSEFERGVSRSELDILFGSCKERITSLLSRIMDSEKKIRTDFLSRRVTRAQQEQLPYPPAR